MRKAGGDPPYKSWSCLLHIEQASETSWQGQMVLEQNLQDSLDWLQTFSDYLVLVQLAKVRYKIKEQGQLTFLAQRMRKEGGVPPYKSWSYLMHNEQAIETGGRVFYTDATGAAGTFWTACKVACDIEASLALCWDFPLGLLHPRHSN